MYIELPNTEISTNDVRLKIVCFKWSWDLKLHVCPHFTLWYMYIHVHSTYGGSSGVDSSQSTIYISEGILYQ